MEPSFQQDPNQSPLLQRRKSSLYLNLTNSDSALAFKTSNPTHSTNSANKHVQDDVSSPIDCHTMNRLLYLDDESTTQLALTGLALDKFDSKQENINMFHRFNQFAEDISQDLKQFDIETFFMQQFTDSRLLRQDDGNIERAQSICMDTDDDNSQSIHSNEETHHVNEHPQVPNEQAHADSTEILDDFIRVGDEAQTQEQAHSLSLYIENIEDISDLGAQIDILLSNAFGTKHCDKQELKQIREALICPASRRNRDFYVLQQAAKNISADKDTYKDWLDELKALKQKKELNIEIFLQISAARKRFRDRVSKRRNRRGRGESKLAKRCQKK